MSITVNIPSQVSQTITNGVTDKAPSEDAVFDALAGKQNSLGFTPEDITNKQGNLNPSSTKYPNVDAVIAGLATKQNSLGYTAENTANKDATGGYVGMTLFKINFKNVLNTFTSFFTNSNTAARTYTFQDRNGIIADDTDVFVPRVQSVTSSATVTPTSADDMVAITAQAAALTLANPTGASVQGQVIVIRIKDNGTARAITYGSEYAAIGFTLPATTVINKKLYLTMIRNTTTTTWDVLSAIQEL